MRNNLVSIRDSLFAAGVEFLEGDNAGLGVRFRKQQITYKTDVKFVDGDAWLQMRYADEPFNCIVSREAIEDFHGFSGSVSDHKLSVAVSEILHHVIAIAERYAPRGIQNGQMIITTKMLTAETS